MQRPNLPPPEYETRPQTAYEIPVAEDPLEAALEATAPAVKAPVKKPLDAGAAKSQLSPDAGVAPESD